MPCPGPLRGRAVSRTYPPNYWVPLPPSAIFLINWKPRRYLDISPTQHPLHPATSKTWWLGITSLNPSFSQHLHHHHMSLSSHYLSCDKNLQTDLTTSTPTPLLVDQATVKVVASKCPYDHLHPPRPKPHQWFSTGHSPDSLPFTSPGLAFTTPCSRCTETHSSLWAGSALLCSDPLHTLFSFPKMPFPCLRPSSTTS